MYVTLLFKLKSIISVSFVYFSLINSSLQKTILTLPLGVVLCSRQPLKTSLLMDLFIFHSVDKDQGDLYTYAKDRDKALESLGPWILDAALPGLSNSVPTTGAEMPNGYLSYQHLLVSGNKKTSCSSDLLQSRDTRLKYANDITVASQIVDRTKLSPYSFLDS